MKKVLTLLILPLMFVFFFPVSVSAETKAGIGPSSFFYIFDTTFENINLFFTFNPEKKAKKALVYAEERLAEAEESANKNEPKAVEKAIDGYKKKILLAAKKSKELKDEKKSEELFNTISENTAKHKNVLENILKKVPDEAKDAILKAIKVSKQWQKKALQEISTFKEEAVESKEEIHETKEELESKDEKLKANDENNEIEQLKQEVAKLRAKEEAQKIAEAAAKKKKEEELLLVQQRKIEEQTKEIEKLKAEKKENDEEIKKDEPKFLTLPNGSIVTIDSLGHIIEVIKEAPVYIKEDPSGEETVEEASLFIKEIATLESDNITTVEYNLKNTGDVPIYIRSFIVEYYGKVEFMMPHKPFTLAIGIPDISLNNPEAKSIKERSFDPVTIGGEITKMHEFTYKQDEFEIMPEEDYSILVYVENQQIEDPMLRITLGLFDVEIYGDAVLEDNFPITTWWNF